MAQFLRDLLLNGYNGVKPIETIQKGNNLGQQVKDVASAELSKKGPRVLFYKQLPSLYGSDLIRISTKGSVDIGRTLAVRGARYVDTNNAGGGGLGRFLGNLLGGSANRPSDTIFPANDEGKGIAGKPPVSVNGQPVNGKWDGLKYAVEAEENYVVSQEPVGKNALTGLLKGNPSDIARNAAGAITGAAKNAVRNVAINAITSKRRNAIGDLSSKLKKSQNLNTTIRVPNTYEKPGSKFIKVKDGVLGIPKLIDFKELGLKERNYLIDTEILNTRLLDLDGLNDLVKRNTGNDLQFIKFKIEGKKQSLLFPAAISGDISDTMTPEWNSFKYVGSPFNTYRYNGVERKISFDFKVYWIDNGQQVVMRDKLNLLRELSYPSSKLTTILLGDNNQYTPSVFSPNIIQMSIGGLFKNIKGFVSNLSISVPQETTWASSNPTFLPANSNIVYPHYVDVSFEMTIIENHSINNNDDTITYRFDEQPDDPDDRPVLPTQPVSSMAGIGPDNRVNSRFTTPQTTLNRQMRRQADFAGNMNVADIGPGGVPNKVAGVIRWDADL
jgi:hypothetical protein